MKRLFLLTVLFSCLTAQAEQVDRSTAFNTAQNYLSAKGRQLNMATTPIRAPRKKAAAAKADDAYYYVFNAEGENGYVIVSGDDRTPAILGYVEEGSFDPNNIPDNMKSWLQLYVDQIKFLDDHNITVNKQALRARHRVQSAKHSIPVLIKTRWNQGDPYNLCCPDYYKEDGTTGRPASGCTNTALAQLMYYYKYPAKIKNMIPSASNTYTLANGTKKTVTQKAIPRNTPIDWDNMCEQYHGGETEEQRLAVGNLMHYLGQLLGAGYGASTGTAFGENVVKGFITNFGYDDSAYMAYRDQYTIDTWFDLIYNELDSDRPVAFAGFSSGGGHAFVLDGFDGDQLFHVNWGWGGGSDGWFLVGILNPGDNSGTGASSSSDGYSMGQAAFCHVQLPDNIKVETSTAMTVHDIAISGTNISANFINWTGSANSFDVAVVREVEPGEYALVGAKQTISNLGANYYQNKTFNIQKKLPEGTYKLTPASKLTSNKTYRPAYNMRDEYIEAVVDEKGVPTLRFVKPNLDISIDTIIFPGKRIVGQEQEVKVTFRNHGDEYYKEVRLFASTTDTKTYTDNRSIVAVRPGECVDVSFYFTPEEEGIYNLWFCTGSDGSGEVGSGTMEVVSEANAQKDNLSCQSFTFSNMTSSVLYGNQMTGYITVKNNAKTAFNGRIKIQLWRQAAGDNVAWSSSSTTVELAIAAARTAQAPFDFQGLDNTSTYRLAVSYVNQSGNLTNGGIWDHGWKITPGALYWKKTGDMAGQKGAVSMSVPSAACAILLDGFKMNRISAASNKNPNTIIVVRSPETMDGSAAEERNLVLSDHAKDITLTSGEPYYIPCNFDADTARFVHTFAETMNGSSWQTFTMPFAADSINVDGVATTLDDEANEFWIYEFMGIGDDGQPTFEKAKELRGNTPYIITCHENLAGRTITFVAKDAMFFQSGTDKMLVSTRDYKMHGATYSPGLKNVYMLNEAGTAFEYVTSTKALPAMSSYFTTDLPDEQRLESIKLPSLTEQVTGIISSDASRLDQSGDIYNLAGQKLTPAAARRGIFITGGKKVVR